MIFRQRGGKEKREEKMKGEVSGGEKESRGVERREEKKERKGRRDYM